jgi:hypothetical protein
MSTFQILAFIRHFVKLDETIEKLHGKNRVSFDKIVEIIKIP